MKSPIISDPYFQVELLAATPNPQQLIHRALHQDYSADPVADWNPNCTEQQSGDVVVKRLLQGGRGHYGCCEAPSITVNAIGFPHSVMQQARTHRVGISFDVQSFRYTSQSILAVAHGKRDVESVFYARPVGVYTDRKGKKYEYTEHNRNTLLERYQDAAEYYAQQIALGLSEEHARSAILFDVRQHFVVSFNLRSALHFMDLRAKADAQLEIQALCEHLWPVLKEWTPQVCEWYEKNRLGKAKLAP